MASSAVEDYHPGVSFPEQHQATSAGSIPRACDICRRKKRRCDTTQKPGTSCSYCKTHHIECTFKDGRKKWGPSKEYLISLETRLERIDQLLQRLCPGTDFSQDFDIDQVSALQSKSFGDLPSSSPSDSSSSPPSRESPPPSIVASALRNISLPMNIPDEGDLEHMTLACNIERFAKQIDIPMFSRFFGNSSSPLLVQTAVNLREQFAGRAGLSALPPETFFEHRREEFWSRRPWETYEQPRNSRYTFPDDDLMTSLVHLYLTRFNCHFPIFHRPTFQKSFDDGLHFRDETFGAIVLLICANASRLTNDPRVLLPGHESRHTSGWKWFSQVEAERRTYILPASLQDLQIICLAVQFLQGSSSSDACWILIGVGLRMAQDVGAHRRKGNSHKPNAEDEQLKRVFWVLLCMDRIASAALGRPCGIGDEEYARIVSRSLVYLMQAYSFDQDLPIECDDEYWETSDPKHAFQQPPEKPSVIAFFNSYLRLTQLLSFVLRSIYAINKSKPIGSFLFPEGEERLVAEFDSALNKWLDSIPEHLRWDPHRTNRVFFNQSVLLYTSFYHLQIMIHRPFIPSPKKPSSLPSLAICANAARACSHILDAQRQRHELIHPHLLMSVFMAAIALLLNIWGNWKSRSLTDPRKQMVDVQRCLLILEEAEPMWLMAGRFRDILYELITSGNLPFARPNGLSLPSLTSIKDVRPPGQDISMEQPTSNNNSNPNPTESRGERHTSFYSDLQLRADTSTPLPVYAEQLPRFPVLDSFDLSPQAVHPVAQPATSVPMVHAAQHPNFSGVPPAAVPSPFASVQMQLYPVSRVDNGLQSPGDLYSPDLGRPASFIESELDLLRQWPGLDIDMMAMWSAPPAGFSNST
ncbi:hypothetical protein HGRIS_006450 [Hohenbuehelia grisea]|uniref:Zn(2)-C6 fungal-type domain-containing protein n=1 Tax=Hohenbuehelia grisea TaxID=104357 RepID=A0ABR3K2N7_9AGAR